MDNFLRLIDIGTNEINLFLDRLGIKFAFSSQLLSTTFIVAMLCIFLLITLIGDKRSRSIVMLFVFIVIVSMLIS